MKTIVVVNKKGGVGKTTLCFNLAGAFAARGNTVLAVDCDFQANLTSGFFGLGPAHTIDPDLTTAAVAAGDPPDFLDLVLATGIEGVNLVPGSLAAEDLDLANPSAARLDLQCRMRELLTQAQGYDVCLIDCHPGGNLLTWQALLAATDLLVPVNPEDFGSLGIGPMLALADRARTATLGNPDLRTLGLVVNRVDARRSLHRAYEAQLRDDYGPLVLSATIPDLTAYPEGVRRQLPVVQGEPRSPAAARMKALAGEILNRLGIGRAERSGSEVARG